MLGRPLTWRNRSAAKGYTLQRSCAAAAAAFFLCCFSEPPSRDPTESFFTRLFPLPGLAIPSPCDEQFEHVRELSRCQLVRSYPESPPLSASSFGVLFAWPPRALIHLVSCAAIVAAGGGWVRPDGGGGHRRGGAPRALHHRRRGGAASAAAARSRRGSAGPLVSTKPTASRRPPVRYSGATRRGRAGARDCRRLLIVRVTFCEAQRPAGAWWRV